MSEKLWFLKNCRLFESISPADLSELETFSRVRRFPKGAPVYLPARPDEGVLLVAQGQVKICQSARDGRRSILAVVDPGEIFGELAVTGDGDADEYAEATEPSTIVLFSADALRQVVEKNAGLAMGITRFVGFRRQRIKRRLQDLLFRSTQDRLTHLLLELAADYGRRVLPDATELSIRLSHLELASIIGSTREGVTLLLEKMQSEGLINVSRRRITIRSLNGLVRIVQTRPQYALEMASTSE